MASGLFAPEDLIFSVAVVVSDAGCASILTLGFGRMFGFLGDKGGLEAGDFAVFESPRPPAGNTERMGDTAGDLGGELVMFREILVSSLSVVFSWLRTMLNPGSVCFCLFARDKPREAGPASIGEGAGSSLAAERDCCCSDLVLG